MEFITKLIFGNILDKYSKIAVQCVEDSFLGLKNNEKKDKAVEFVIKQLEIPLFLKNIPFLYCFLCRHLKEIQVFLAGVLSEEIDYFIEKQLKELK